MKVSIQASEVTLDPSEVRAAIPSEKLALLEGKGEIRAYRLAHEGTSQPKVLTEGAMILRWPRAVIRRLTEKIQAGTKFFVGHREGTNSHEGRRSVGEVLASFAKEIGGKLSSIVIGHFPDKTSIAEMDVCSMEADVVTEDDVVGDVNDITAVALGNSSVDSPAFPGATLLSTLQCFEKPDPGEGGTKVADQLNFEQVKEAVRRMNIHPWQLYDEKDLRSDREFGKVYEKLDATSKENERLTAANKELETNSKEASRKGEIAEAGTRLDKILTDGVTDRQRTFIKRQFDPAKMEDLSDDALGKFVENSKKEFAETARLFGVAGENDNHTTSKSGDDKEKDDSEGKSLEDQALEAVIGKRDG